MSLLNFNFVIIYIIHKILVLLKNYLSYLQDSISDSIFKICFLKEYDILFFLVIISQHIMMESLIIEEENIIKDIRITKRITKLHCN